MPVPAATHLALAKVAAEEQRAWTKRRNVAIRKAAKAGATADAISRATALPLRAVIEIRESL